MKRFLLSLSFLGAVLFGHSQVILNELYTEKSTYTGKINVQYFELYNAGNSPVDLNCYTIISQYSVTTGNGQNAVTKKGYYVIDLPDVQIPARGYYVGAAAGGPTTNTTSGGVTYKPNFNWNAGLTALSAIGASFRNYELNGNSYKDPVDVTSSTTDFFTAQPTGDIKHNVFLFNNGIYVNGFVSYGSAGSSNIPAIFNNVPDLNITTTTNTTTNNSCGPYTINWKNNVKESEFVGAATGNGHGYFRGKNGLCGTWDKLTLSSVAYATPTTENPTGSVTTTGSGIITSTQAVICGTEANTSTVSFTMSGTNDQSVFPLTVELYYDNGTPGALDNSDLLQPGAITITSSDPLPFTGTFTIPSGRNVLLVYRTHLGCISDIKAPTTTATLITSQYNVCNTQAGFSITNADAKTLIYGFPVTVEFIYDGARLGTPITVTEPSTTVYYSEGFTDLTKLSIKYTPANCLSTTTVSNATTPFTQVTGSLTTSQTLVQQIPQNNYPTRVKVDIEEITTNLNFPYPNSVFPIEVRLYIDNDPTNQTPDTAAALYPNSYLGSVYFNSLTDGPKTFNEAKQLLTANDQHKDIYIAYQPNLSCFGKVVKLPLPEAIILPVTYKSFTATRNGNKVALVWETAMEENNRGFHVQRNIDGSWKDVAFVFTQAEGGNSNAVLRYSYNDINTSKGISQYRILQVDMDGTGKYSEIRAVKGEDQASKVLVFPNPSHTGSVNVLFDDATSVRDVIVSDVAGRVVKHYKAVSSNSLVIENLVNGYYTVQIINHTTAATTVEKVIIKKR